ncbi:MAG: sigma-70 family RNA polymerase sigma factor [Bryobacteraceae bacterium]
MDLRLQPYLDAADEADAESVLGEIITGHAAPVVRNIVAARLTGSADAEDVASGVILELISRIRGIRSGSSVEPIEDLAGYAAKAAYNSCNGYFRAQAIDTIADLAVVDQTPGPDRIAESRLFARRLWEEVQQLPVNQRRALLLNAKDNALSLFPVCGVASIRQIAHSLEMQPEELATLWNDLPMEDQVLAARLQITRQQVINLRMSARKRLANRLRDWR